VSAPVLSEPAAGSAGSPGGTGPFDDVDLALRKRREGLRRQAEVFLRARLAACAIRSVYQLIPYALNAPTHSDEQVAQIADFDHRVWLCQPGLDRPVVLRANAESPRPRDP
jgi:hypothetical protein